MINIAQQELMHDFAIPHNSVCFTGHRTLHKVYMGYEFNDDWMRLHKAIFSLIHGLYLAGWHHFVVGGALGVDMLAGINVEWMMRQGNYPEMCLYLAIPHKNYNDRWRGGSIDEVRLNRIIAAASVTILDTSPQFKIPMLFSRNHWMVDKTSLTCAIYDGRGKGGALECMNYAIKQGKRICTINPIAPNAKGELDQIWT